MRKALEEKDAQISGLEIRYEDLEKKSKDNKKVNDKKFKDLETVVKKIQKKVNLKMKINLKCQNVVNVTSKQNINQD